MEILGVLKGLAEVLETQNRSVENTRLALRAAILDAHSKQVPVRVISQASGYTTARIYQILGKLEAEVNG
jgi:hypothetical protein